jgi:hypothetical protein
MLSLETLFREKMLTKYQKAPIDLASFYRKYKYCDLKDCIGLCCHGGVGFYMKEEPETIRKVAAEHAEFFQHQGLAPFGELFDEELNDKTGLVELYTNTREESYPEGLMPPHFPHTSCIFRRGDGACTLQVLSVEQNKPSWWFKPIACWMFPLEMEKSGEPHIHIAHASTDEYVDPTYAGFVEYTKCGAECPDGKPAYQVLEYEIKTLSRFLERDLMSEILAYKEVA